MNNNIIVILEDEIELVDLYVSSLSLTIDDIDKYKYKIYSDFNKFQSDHEDIKDEIKFIISDRSFKFAPNISGLIDFFNKNNHPFVMISGADKDFENDILYLTKPFSLKDFISIVKVNFVNE